MAYTNHALDHMLANVLDGGVTRNLVRLGTRSSDDRIEEYTLRAQEEKAGQSPAWKRQQFKVVKEIEEELSRTMRKMLCFNPPMTDVLRYLRTRAPAQAVSLSHPPTWIAKLLQSLETNKTENGVWSQAGRSNGRGAPASPRRLTVYDHWKDGADLNFTDAITRASGAQHDLTSTVDPDVLAEYFAAMKLGSQRSPQVPSSNRSVNVLAQESDLWAMSKVERNNLAHYWEDGLREAAYQEHLGSYEALKKRYHTEYTHFNSIKEEVHRENIFFDPN